MNTTLGPFTVHPALASLPLMEGNEFAALTRDIKRNGLWQPIILNHDRTVLIDGRNRFLACVESGVDPVFTTLAERYTEEMILDYIVSANIRRRHVEQPAPIAASRMSCRRLGGYVDSSYDQPMHYNGEFLEPVVGYAEEMKRRGESHVYSCDLIGHTGDAADYQREIAEFDK